MKNRLFIVFGIDHYNPLGIIRSLGENGINPVFIAIPGRAPVASASRYISKTHFVKDYVDGCRLLLDVYGDYPRDNLPIVVTSDDEQVGYMDEHYDEYKDKFIFFNAGSVGRISEFMDKYNILQLAKKHGLKTLDAVAVKKGEIPKDIDYPVITKSIAPNIGGWKSDVYICNSKSELQSAYKKIKSPIVLIQKYIDKKNEVDLEGLCVDKGKQTFIAIELRQKYNIRGYYSPYHDVVNFENDEINKSISSMMEEIGFEGIFEVNFLVSNDNQLYFSEINFRNSTWSYASTVARMNLPLIWAQSMLKGHLISDYYKEISPGFTDMVEPIDYQKRVVENGYNLDEWHKDFLNARCKYYYNEQDLEPFYVMLENNNKLR